MCRQGEARRRHNERRHPARHVHAQAAITGILGPRQPPVDHAPEGVQLLHRPHAGFDGDVGMPK